MKYIEGKVWSVSIEYTTSMAAKVIKRVEMIAPTAERAIAMAREAVALNGVVTACIYHDYFDGIVVE
jgi:hypothetical protein